ncbi:MAG: hypothetical protein JW768_09360 [Chitinispirillaceae bacterium]|nr:hypothetical protein [Chitinispirillaceae bacterium]
MKKLCIFLLAGAVLSGTVAEKPVFEPYGFVKGDMYYTVGGVTSWGQPSLTCASRATGSDTNAVSFTAQHTRFGLRGSGAAGDITMGGLIELDFFVIAANANAKPRMRLAYAWCRPVQGLEIRAGQQWDLFSPLNPTTNNTNANLWYDGNYGFRRPQLTLQYGMDLGAIKPLVQVSAGETAREDDLKFDTTGQGSIGSWIGADNLSGIPLVQGRLAAGFLEGMEIGAAAVYGAYGVDRDYTTMGVSVDASLPVHALLALKAEFATGTNLNNANIFTIGGSGSAAADVETNGFWVEATSKPLSYFNVVLGFGDEMVSSTVADDSPESNMTFYGDLIFPIGGFFSLAAEYQLLSTKLAGQDDANIAHMIDIAGKVVF